MGCGYKPSSSYIKEFIGETIFIEVIIDRKEPENGAYLKDSINEMVYTRFKSKIVAKELAQSKLSISYGGSNFTPLVYKDGYIVRYRLEVNVTFKFKNEKESITRKIKTLNDFDIQENSYTSSNLRIEAIKVGLDKALDEFLAFLSAKGAKI